MKYFSLLAGFLLLFVHLSTGRTLTEPPAGNHLLTNVVSFTENKGQIRDQYSRARPDVLFSGTDGRFSFHITGNGISYQLKGSQASLHRVDVNWLNTTKNIAVIKGSALPGCNNYYYGADPQAITNVRSFNSITLKNIYKGIDLYYYEKNGQLKYDYIVHAGADFKKIQFQVKGANVVINSEGSLLMQTPFGAIEEQAPVVYQDERQLASRYVLENGIVKFEILQYDPSKTLIIDPVIRSWGTYYGGSNDDMGRSVCVDLAGNSYLTGSTESSNAIATVGSHQVAYAPGVASGDAFLVKFNAAGVRQWATYYGGSEYESGYGCVADNSGNVYLVGSTSTSVTNVISTSGSHQNIFGGVQDAFLAKFNSSGVRVWATYYGGAGIDAGNAIAIGPSGDIYIAGEAGSSTNISTSGTHQASLIGVQDAFVARFTPAGVRVWGTYLGGNGAEWVNSVAVDLSENIYFSGTSTTPNGTLVATPGSHQDSPAGGASENYLAKLNSAGIRQWGTYYGGSGSEYGGCVNVDMAGNVYLGGFTSSSSGTGIATPASHQPIYGGGMDGFLAKFNSVGVRQWGTYYGGGALEAIYNIAISPGGHIYIAGEAQSVGTNVISTTGSYQQLMNGGNDAFLARFDAAGNRIWGTYYGATSSDFAFACAFDPTGGVYLAGYTSASSGTGVASPGSHQPLFGGANTDAFIVKFNTCSLTAAPTASANSPICRGDALTLSGTISNTAISSWSWMGPNSFTSAALSVTVNNMQSYNAGLYKLIVIDTSGCEQNAFVYVPVSYGPSVTVNSGTICSGTSFTINPSGAVSYTFEGGSAVVNPTVSSNYTVSGTGTDGCVSQTQATCSVIVYTLPVISSLSGTICMGDTFNIAPSGANTFTIQGGTALVSPTVSSGYTIAGTSLQGCTSSSFATSNVTVMPLPTITVNSGSVCIGSSFTLVPSGANLYFIQGGNAVVSPTSTTSYTVAGIDTVGCISASTATAIVNVLTLTVTAFSSPTIICAGDTATISASGANTYTWSNSSITAQQIVTPTVTTTYTVIGADFFGCQDTAMVTQSVNSCLTGTITTVQNNLVAYPNPFNSQVTFQLPIGTAYLKISNMMGLKIFELQSPGTIINLDLSVLPPGIYLIETNTESRKITKVQQ
jgi:hypothetical protein